MSWAKITRTTVARNPQDTASPGAPAAQTALNWDSGATEVRVWVGTARGIESYQLTTGEQVLVESKATAG